MKFYYLDGDILKDSHHTKNICYFDNNATTLILDKDVKDGIIKWISCGNPSNTLHDFGMMAHNKIEQCRHFIARDLSVLPNEIYFTSGATESNNIVIQGIIHHYMDTYPTDKFTAITSSFEHPSVLNVFKHYDENPYLDVIYVDPCADTNDPEYGCVKADDVRKAIDNAKQKVIIISIMHANNETGSIQNIKRIGRLAKDRGIFMHSDTTQSMGKFVINPRKLNLDAISFSGHKFHGPKGIGGLYIAKEHNEVVNLCFGGEQEGHKRPGTENVANIVGMTIALGKAHQDRKEKNKKLNMMKEFIIRGINKYEPITILGPTDYNRVLPNTILMMINNLDTCNKMLVKKLNKKKIYVSVGSACQTNSGHASHVLDVLGLNKEDKLKVIRVSICDYTTLEECKYFIKGLITTIRESRK